MENRNHNHHIRFRDNNDDVDDDDDNHGDALVVADEGWRIDPATLQTSRTSNREILSGLTVIPVKTCQSVEYLIHPKQCEDTGVVAMIVSLTTAANSKAATVVNSGGSRSYTSGTGANARLRLSSNVTAVRYDRIVTLADCSSTNGDVFAFMMRTKTESERAFDALRVGQEGVGDLVLLEEVYPVDDTLGTTTNVALIKRCSYMLPLCGSVPTLVPQVPLMAPDKGDTRYFCRHHDRRIEFGHVTIAQAICGGRLCDRQLVPTGTGQSCGCFYKTERHNPLVVEMTVTFPVPKAFAELTVHSVVAFRSLRTSRLFVTDECWDLLDCKNPTHVKALRKAVDRIANYINKKGGWSYVGWLRTGTVTDESDTAVRDAENIASLTQSPHLSYLLPSNANDTSTLNVAFQRLRLRPTDLR